MNFKILLWNARGLRNKKEEIYVRSQDYDICVITETKSKRTDHFMAPGFTTISKSNYNMQEGGAGGVAIFIRYGFYFLELTNLNI